MRSSIACSRNRRMGTTTKRRRRPYQLDVHNRQSSRKNGPRLSRHIQRVIITVARYQRPILSKLPWKVACPAASASSGCAICRLNGTSSSRRSDSLPNNAVPDISNGAGSKIAIAVGMRGRAARRGILDTETTRKRDLLPSTDRQRRSGCERPHSGRPNAKRPTRFQPDGKVPSGMRLGIRVGELSGNMKLSFQAARSIGLINGFCGEGLPTIDLAHADLSRGEQRPEHHRGGVGRRQHGLGLIRRLNSSCNRSIAFVVRRLPGPNR
jgi:hypothetical protein